MRDAIRTIGLRPFAVAWQWVKPVTVDLIGASVFVLLATALLAVWDVTSPVVRAAVGAPLLFLAPGYATVAFLFPRSAPARRARRRTVGKRPTEGVSGAERAALSFGASFALLPLLALPIAASPWGFTGPVVVGTVSGFTLVGVGLAAVRRSFVPASDRYRVTLGGVAGTVRSTVFGSGSVLHAVVTLALVCSVVLSVATVGYALVAPQDGERYTSMRLLTEDESGDLVASGYPAEIEPGESIPLVVAVENREGQDTNYTVVVQEQRLEDGDVVERTELQRIDYALSDGATGYGERTITPRADEGTIRLAFLLYDGGEVPNRPAENNAYRYTYFWTDVRSAAG